MRIVVTTDLHANLPALQAVLQAVRAEGYDLLFHTGDAIGIGPQPRECLDLLLSTPRIRLVMGNHDAYYAHGLPEPRPPSMSEEEAAHHRWVHRQLGAEARGLVQQWPYQIAEEHEGLRMLFVHYGLTGPGQEYAPVVRHATAQDLDAIFDQAVSEIVFYGHNHEPSNKTGRARYVNPGSLGCASEAIARYFVVNCAHGHYELLQQAVPYDDRELFQAFETQDVPAREFICSTFFGGRFK